MRSRGAELIEHGSDYQEAYEHAQTLAQTQGYHMVPSFDDALVRGVASYSLELFREVSDIHTVYVPIGLGSGICGAIAARDALGIKAAIVGVVPDAAPAYGQSFAKRTVIAQPVGPTLADGIACRTPNAEALEIIVKGVERIVIVDEREIHSAMRALFTDTHNVAEGAGAAALAAALRERSANRHRRVAVVQTGGNVDASVFAQVLANDVDQQCGTQAPSADTQAST